MNMKHTTLFLRTPWFIGAALLFTQLSCTKDLAEPPVLGDAGITANTSIQALKARYNGGQALPITLSLIHI